MRSTKYRPEFPEELLEMARNGLLPQEVAAKWEVSVDTVKAWGKDPLKPKFVKAYKQAPLLREAWWINKGREGFQGKLGRFNSPCYMYMMAAVFGGPWRKDPTIEINTGKQNNMTDAELNELIARSLPADLKLPENVVPIANKDKP